MMASFKFVLLMVDEFNPQLFFNHTKGK